MLPVATATTAACPNVEELETTIANQYAQRLLLLFDSVYVSSFCWKGKKSLKHVRVLNVLKNRAVHKFFRQPGSPTIR